jgi:hypothetical protein
VEVRRIGDTGDRRQRQRLVTAEGDQVRPDADGEHGDDDQRVAGAAQQDAGRVTDVAKHC